MKDFKVLLIHANSMMDTLIPPNIGALSAFLRRAGINVKLFDTTFYRTRDVTGDDVRAMTLQVRQTNFEGLGICLNKTDMYDDFIKMVKEYRPDLIGLSAVELTYPFGIRLLMRLRSEGLNITTIVGGTHATIDPGEVIKENCVDFVCVGEGEKALVELCEALRDKNDTSGIKNIWAKRGQTIIKNPLRPTINLDTLPFQDWSIFDEKRIYKPMGGKIRRTGCFELSRGCPYSCTYCCNEFLHKLYNRTNYRERSISRFIEEVKYMKERYGLEYIYIAAEAALSTSQQRFVEFIDSWKCEIKLPFWVETRPEAVTEKKAKMLEEAGCASVSVGLESGDPDIRQMLNRKMADDKITAAFDILKKTKMRICANNIIGFPGETREQVFRTIELNRRILIDNIMIHVFNPYRGTRLYDLCVKKGYILANTLGKDYRADVMLDMPQLSKDETRGLQRTFALYVRMPKSSWPEIKLAESLTEVGNKKFDELSNIYREKFL